MIIIEFSAGVRFSELSEGRNRDDITDSSVVSVAPGKSLPLFEDTGVRCQNLVAHERRAKKSVARDEKNRATRIAPRPYTVFCVFEHVRDV